MSSPSNRHRAAGRLEQPGDQPARRRLAAAGLADEAEGLALCDGEVDAVDGLHGADLLLEDDAAGHREVLLQPRRPRAAARRSPARRRRSGGSVAVARLCVEVSVGSAAGDVTVSA